MILKGIHRWSAGSLVRPVRLKRPGSGQESVNRSTIKHARFQDLIYNIQGKQRPTILTKEVETTHPE